MKSEAIPKAFLSGALILGGVLIIVAFFIVASQLQGRSESESYQITFPSPTPPTGPWVPISSSQISAEYFVEPTPEGIAGTLFGYYWLGHFYDVNAGAEYQLADDRVWNVELPPNMETLAQERQVDFIAKIDFL